MKSTRVQVRTPISLGVRTSIGVYVQFIVEEVVEYYPMLKLKFSKPSAVALSILNFKKLFVYI